MESSGKVPLPAVGCFDGQVGACVASIANAYKPIVHDSLDVGYRQNPRPVLRLVIINFLDRSSRPLSQSALRGIDICRCTFSLALSAFLLFS
jgi:hypothetical protein